MVVLEKKNKESFPLVVIYMMNRRLLLFTDCHEIIVPLTLV